jgi:tRNA threonylcarbamoyladenosine biosynthesis protein TsaB
VRVLALETATPVVSAAVVDASGVLGEVTLRAPARHLEALLPLIEALLRDLDLSPPDVEAVAVSRGPGGFTSLRIGIATAAAWARARNVPLVGVGTLEALAQGACGAGLVLAALDAHRGEVAAALYDLPRCPEAPVSLLPPLVAPPDLVASEVGRVLAERPGAPVLVVGEGQALLRALGERAHSGGLHVHPRGALVGAVALRRLARGERDDPDRLLPLYGRRLEVRPWQEMPHRPGNGQ